MSINPQFKSIEDFYQPETKKPLSPPDLPIQTFRDDPGSLLIPNTAKDVPINEPVIKPDFFGTLGHAFKDYNEFAIAGRFVSRELEFTHPASDDVPDDFNPRDFKHLEGYPANYWDWISEAASPNEISARQQYVTQKVAEEEFYANGSLTANLIGGFGGALLSPSSLIPISSMKYATLGQATIKGALQAAPGVALQTIAHEGFRQATDAGGNMQDFAINSLRDTAFGVAFMGLGHGLGAGLRGGQLWNMRKASNYLHQGIDFAHEIDPETGAITGKIKAVAGPGYSLNAAKVDQAQQFADVAAHNGFIFGLPGIQKLAGNSILGSPIVKGLTHRFGTVRKFTDLMASHSILTKDVLEGRARPEAAEDIMSSINAGAADFHLQFKQHFYEENGIEGGANIKNAAKALKQRALGGETTSWENFNRNVIDAVINQDFSYSKSTNAAAKLYTEYTDNIYSSLLKARNLNPDILPPRNARGYFTINPDHIVLVKDQERFRQVIADEFKRQDAKLEEITRPLNEAKRVLSELEAHKLSGKANDKEVAQQIKDARTTLRRAQKEIERKARSGQAEDEDYGLLLHDRNFITLKESTELKSLLKPINEAKTKTTLQADNVVKLKAEYKKYLNRAKNSKTKEGTKKNIELIKKMEKEIKNAEDEHLRLKGEQEDLQFELNDRAHNGEIKQHFFTKDENIIHWRDPKEWAKFREPFESDRGRMAAAEAQRNLYLNNTPEQVQQAMLSSMMPSEFANPLKRRSFMVPAALMNKEKFTRGDVPQATSSYSRTLGKHIALNKVFGDINMMEGEHGPLGMARILAEERTGMEKKINENPDVKQRTKDLLKLDKDFRDAGQFMKRMTDVFMGNVTATAATIRFNRAIKNFAAATKLGGVPIAQLTDLGAIILKQGMWPFLRDGLKPMLQGLFHGEISAANKRNAADAHLALQHIEGGYSQKYYDSASIGEVPISTHLESALDNVAHLSGNFYGTNFIENANQRLTATIMQSKIMRHMYEYLDGTLSKNDETALLQYGLDPKEWAERFTKNFEGSTGWKDELGAYQSKYWEWKDDAAVERMAQTLRRGVYDTVIQRGLFTSPFWTNNPILGTIFMFHGWSFAAFNRYTVPMMQRLDAQKMIGIGFMLGLGAMTDPMREFANGAKPDLEKDDTWFGKAFNVVSNSGVLGQTTDMIQTFNKMVDGALLPSMTTRYKGWNKFSILGPAAGIGEDFMSLAKAGLTGKLTEGEAKRAARLVPLAGSLPLRSLVNHWIESLNLPQSEKDAAGYTWRQ